MLNFPVPHELSKEDLFAIGDILKLSESQRSLLDTTWKKFQAGPQRAFDERLEPMVDTSYDLGDLFIAERYTRNLRDRYADLMEDGLKLCTEAHTKQLTLFVEIEPYLAESQAALLPQARNWLKRRHAKPEHAMYPGSGVDLVQILRDIDAEFGGVRATDRDAYDILLASYDRTLTERAQHQYEVGPRLRIAGLRAATEMDEKQNQARYSQRLLDAGKRIHDLNVRSIISFKSVLAASDWKELDSRFRLSCYDPVYPDNSNVAGFLDSLLNEATLNTEQREALTAARDQFVSRQTALNEQMIERYLKWAVFRWLNTWAAVRKEEFARYEAEMRALNDQRIENARTAFDYAEATIDDHSDSELVKRLRRTLTELLKKPYNPDPSYRTPGRS